MQPTEKSVTGSLDGWYCTYLSEQNNMFYSFTKAWTTAWVLAGSRYSSSALALRLKNKFRWTFIAAINPLESLDWFNQLNIKDMRPFSEHIPYLAFQPMRVFMSNNWDIAKRKKVIRDTYQCILTCKGALQEALLRSDGFTLARLHLDGYGEVSIVLCYDNSLRKEGVLMLSLRSASLREPVIQMAFSFEEKSKQQRVCYIGCIQGRSSKDEIKMMTKAMNGLRPNIVMIFIVQEMMSVLGLTHLMGVGNAIHPHHNKYLIHLPFVHERTFDYDALWTDMGALPDPDGWFVLPLKTERRSNNEMKPNKRAMYHRRYAMMDELSVQIQASLAGIGK